MNPIPYLVRGALNRSLAASLLATVLSSPGHASVIDTSTGGGPFGFVNGFGSSAQTFVAPSDNFLKELQFFVAPLVAGPGTTSVALAVRHWSGNNAFGAPLYAGSFTRPAEGGAITVSDLDLELTEGELYGFTLNFFTYRDGTASFGKDRYADGMLLVRGPGSGQGSYSASPANDLRFVATFAEAAPSAVSEPSSALLGSFGLAALAVLRRQARAAPASPLGARATT